MIENFFSQRYTSLNKKIKCSYSHKASRHPTKCDIINDVKQFQTISQDMLSQIFDIQSEVALQIQVH